MAVSAAPERIDHLQTLRVATGRLALTHTDGVATITTPFQKVFFATCIAEDAPSTGCIASVQSITGGSVVFELLEQDATVGTTAEPIYYLIIGY